MDIYYDTEFHEDGKTIDLISIGLRAADGGEMYLINKDADWERISAHPWLRENVLPHLPGAWGFEMNDQWRPDETDGRVHSRKTIAYRVRSFIEGYGANRDKHQLWAWYGAYDHVALAQLFGRMIDLPSAIPMHTNDLKTLVGDERIPEDLRGDDEHHALADARFNQRVHHWIKQRHANLKGREGLRIAADVARLVTGEEAEILVKAWQGLSIETRAEVSRLTRGTPLVRQLDGMSAIRSS